jgi:putative nucleotidyltransferase with HDIG domain
MAGARTHTGAQLGLEALRPGAHACVVTPSSTQAAPAILRWMMGGLTQGQRLICVGSGAWLAHLPGLMDRSGIRPGPWIDRGRLSLMPAALTRQGRPPLGQDPTVWQLRNWTRHALESGFSGVRLLLEMSCLVPNAGAPRLVELEAALDDLVREHPALCLCLYDRRRFDPDLLVRMIELHALVVHGDQLLPNPAAVTAAELMEDDHEARRLDAHLAALARLQRQARRPRGARNVDPGLLDALADTEEISSITLDAWSEQRARQLQRLMDRLRHMEHKPGLQELAELLAHEPAVPNADDLAHSILAVQAERGEPMEDDQAGLVHTLAGLATTTVGRMREQIEREHRRLEGLVQTLPDAVVVLSPQGHIRMANPSAQQLLRSGGSLRVGDPLTHLAGQPILPGPEHPATEPLRRTIHGLGVHDLELELRRLDPSNPGSDLVAVLRGAVKERNLLTAEQSRRRELTALYTLSRQLADARVSETVLETVAREVVDTLRVSWCRVISKVEDRLVCQAAHGRRGLSIDLCVDRREPPDAVRLYRRVLEQRRPLVLRRDRADLSPATAQALGLDSSATVCLVPLRVRSHSIGVLVLGEVRTKERAPFSEDKLKTISAIADQTASALRRTSLSAELEQSYLQTSLALANAMDARDTYTSGHSQRMAAWAEGVARELGLADDEIGALRWGALLHDIGKIGVPDHILRKRGPLDDQEWTVMRRHPEIGARIVEHVRMLAPVAPIIRHHHERLDGSGYPAGMKGEMIPVGARVIAVADTYVAMTDERTYRRARTHQDAVAVLVGNQGRLFDLEVVQAFLRVLAWERNEDAKVHAAE